MNAFLPLPSQFRWSAQQLADAVTLRLTKAVNFNAMQAALPNVANGYRRRQCVASGYAPTRAALSTFRVR